MESRKKHSNLFLMELIIAIFFFSIISAVCVQLFSEAYSLSKKSTDLTKAVNITSNLAEGIRSWDGSLEQWEQLFPGGSWQEDVWQLAYDADWQPTSHQGCNLLQVQFGTEEAAMAHIRVSKQETGETIYELDVVRTDREEGR